MTSDTSSRGQAGPRISWWKMTDSQIIDAMTADTVVNKVRKLFSHAVARLEQEGAQRRPAGIVDIRRMEFEEAEKIVKAVEGDLHDHVEALEKALAQAGSRLFALGGRSLDQDAENIKLRDVLKECRLQIEYLDEKFKSTGTSQAVLARIDAVLGAAEQRGEK